MGFLDNIKKKTEGITSQLGDISSKAVSSFKGSKLISSELEQLINSAIINGQMSDAARATLHRRAMKEGVDPDELDLIINAKLAKMAPQVAPPPMPQVQQQAAAPPAMPAMPAMPQAPSNKHGSIKKCPNCGAPVTAFNTHCEMCGHEFTNVAAASSITALFNKLQELDDQLNKQISEQSVVGKIVGSLTSSDKKLRNDFLERKLTTIRTFPIPNTKGDILEFLTMTASLGKKKSIFSQSSYEDMELAKAWREKCVQVIHKARILLKNDTDAMAQVQMHAKEFKVK